MGLLSRTKNIVKPPVELNPAQVEAVVELLGNEFELDETLRELVRRMVTAYDGTGHFEFILDCPASARWRLKPDTREHPLGLRVGYHGYTQADQPPPRHERLNAELHAIVSGTAPETD